MEPFENYDEPMLSDLTEEEAERILAADLDEGYTVGDWPYNSRVRPSADNLIATEDDWLDTLVWIGRL